MTCQALIQRDACRQVTDGFRLLTEELEANNKLLLPRPLGSRSERGAMNIADIVANTLLGVLDSY